jgi:thymidylate synthase
MNCIIQLQVSSWQALLHKKTLLALNVIIEEGCIVKMENEYHRVLKEILQNGERTEDRTGVGTISVFGTQMRFNLKEGFPAITTKKLAWKSVVGELLWMLEGSTDERRLAEITYGKDRTELVGKHTIWTANADAQGVALGHVNGVFYKGLGPVYGAQWREFNSNSEYGDQVNRLLEQIKKDPASRRHILTAWNPLELHAMALPPCHVFAQFNVRNGLLSCQMYQRSADMFLGVPFNVASYSLLTHIVARELDLDVGDFVHTIGDAHIYSNHVDQVNEQLSRDPYSSPILNIHDDFLLKQTLSGDTPINAVNKFSLLNYQHHPFIEAPMAV